MLARRRGGVRHWQAWIGARRSSSRCWTLSDEIWHWYEGAGLELFGVSESDWVPRRTVLGPAAEGSTPVGVVPAGEWQAARPLGGYTLVGCSVGPGFDFEDFTLLAADDAAAAAFRERVPELASLI